MTLKYYGFSVAALAVLVGCGGTTTGASGDHDAGDKSDAPVLMRGNDAGGDEGATKGDSGVTDSSVDHGTVSTTYPAFPPFMAQVINNGGGVITNPDIVTVSWSTADSNFAAWEAFDDAIGASSYWTTTTSEYGVGAATGGTHVELTTPPTFGSMSDLESFVAANAGTVWPPTTLTANTLYMIYLPPGVSINVQGIGDACSNGVGGYHDQTGGPGSIVFGVVLDCTGDGPNDVTLSASHEIIEAATDPYDNNSYYGFDDTKYLAWDLFQQQQDELGDMCEFYPDFGFLDPELSAGVQRTWSNKSAAGGHAPCVPAESGPYTNVTPLMQQNVSIDVSMFGGPSNYPGLGYYIPIGGTGTIPIGFYSDSASPPWNIVVHAGSPLSGATANVTTSLDTSSGQNGTTANITVKVNAQDSTGTNSNVITVESLVPGDQMIDFGGGVSIGVHSHWMPILISSQK
jgi:hypothetical protein